MEPSATDSSDVWVTRDVRDESPDPERSKSLFLAKIKHDLRTPMNHIIGYSEILLETAEDYGDQLPKSFLDDLERIHLSGKQMLGFINDLFDPLKQNDLGLAVIRHHLRCNLSNVIGYSEILLEDSDVANPEVFVPDLQKIHSAGRRLLGLIDDLPELGEEPPASAAAHKQPAQNAGRETTIAAQAATVLGGDAPKEPANRAKPDSHTLLVVDDNEENRDMLARRLTGLGYAVECAEHGLEALNKLQAAPFDLVLLDVMMPILDGYQTLQRIKSDAALRHLPVIMISALDDITVVTRCIEIGAEDYLPKPFDPVLLRARISSSLDRKRLHDVEQAHRLLVEEYNQQLEQQVKEQVREISMSQLGMIFALSKLAESRDPETGEHLERICEYCQLLADNLAQSERYADVLTESYIENLYTASVLHDIGKVGVPDHILQKTGKLTDSEFEIIKTHTTMGGKTLRLVDERHPGNEFIRIGIDIAEGHHEKWDGTGYPSRLAGEAIPLSARITALADVYDALRSQRCYKPALSHAEAREIILKSRGGHFDPDIVDAFLAVETQFDSVWIQLTVPGCSA